jgi:hypothetical protein
MKPNDGVFKENERIQLHPATDLWMRGAKFGTVVSISKRYVYVHVDKLGCIKRFRERDLLHLE